MFNFKVMNAAVTDDRITGYPFQILYFILNGIEGDSKDIGVRFIASKLKMKWDTVKTALDKLEDAGYLQVVNNGNGRKPTIKLNLSE